MPSSTTMPPTNTRGCADGWPVTRAGPSTSPRPRHPGFNAVEGFFAKLTRQRLKRGVFQSVVDLQLAINRFVAETNADPKPFVWTADPKLPRPMARPSASSNPHFANGPTLAPTRTLINDLLS